MVRASRCYSVRYALAMDESMDSHVDARMNVVQWLVRVATGAMALMLVACGGGGGSPGTCHGSPQVCGGGSSASAPVSGAVAGLFSQSGTGDGVVTLPANVTRVRIQADFAGVAQNFVVKVAGASVVNEIVGTSRNPAGFAGTILVPAGSVVAISGTDVTWQITEVRPGTAPAAGLFSQSGTGPAVLDLPATTTRVRIHAEFGGIAENFIVRLAGALLVNEILGTAQNLTSFDTTLAVQGGGTMEILEGNGVSWSVQQVQ